MKDIDANDLISGSILTADICIVGGGAAGIAIAKQFVNTNCKVLLVESGSHAYDAPTQSLYEFENVGHPMRAQAGYISRNRYLGGSTNTWHGGCAPLSDIDFEKREWVPGSGWPLSKKDIDPYYRQASNFLGLPSYDLFNNTKWKRHISKCPDDFLDDKTLSPAFFLFAKKPLNTRLAYAGLIKKSRNIQVCLNANVTEIEANHEQTNIECIHASTIDGKRINVKAKQYVLACGGWENARLLLLSQRHSEKGLGNQFDVVGRYYSEHPKIVTGKIHSPSTALRSPIMIWKRRIDHMGKMRLSMKLSEDVQRQHRLLNHYIQPIYPQSLREAISSSESFVENLNFSLSSVHRLAKLSSSIFELADAFERMFFNMPLRFHDLGVVSHFEQIPNRESFVRLSDEKDILGQNKIQVSLKVSSDEKSDMIRYHEVFDELLQQKGLGRLEIEFPDPSSEWKGLSDSSHHIGTTRMSDDPKFGVVDKNCRVHGISNLYIASSSVFPTGGHVNPTYTIVAIALRLAEHLREKVSL